MTATATAHPGSEQAQQYDRAKLGMWLFLASEVMFFTGFLGAYIALRMAAPERFPNHELNKVLAGFNTIVLICSSLTMALGVNSIQRGNVGALKKYLLFTILLGATFLVVKGIEYSAKF